MRKVIKAVMFTLKLSLSGLSESCMWTYVLSKKALLDDICYILLNIQDIIYIFEAGFDAAHAGHKIIVAENDFESGLASAHKC